MRPFSRSLPRRIGRVGRRLPWGRVLLLGEIAAILARHVALLDGPERRRLGTLLARAARHPRSLSDQDGAELRRLVAKLQPRVLVGSAVRRVVPVPIPARLLYGARAPQLPPGRRPDR